MLFIIKVKCNLLDDFVVISTGSRGGAVVEALAFHQCGPGSIPGPGVICGLSLLLVLVLAPRVFLRVFFGFPTLINQHFQIPIPPACEAHLIIFI